MDFKKVKLINFKNYVNEEINLHESSFWILRGKNSAGKSTLACDALTYALFGKVKAMEDTQDSKITHKDVIRRGTTKTEVRIEFTHRKASYIIIRTRTQKKSVSTELVSIMKDGKWILDEEKKTDADKWINEHLWNYSDFTNTSLILQNEMTKALELTRGERKDYLEKLFGIKDFEEMAKLSRKKASEIDNEINIISGQIEILSDPSKKINLHQLKQEKSTLNASYKTKEVVLTGLRKKLEESDSELKDLITDKQKLENIILRISSVKKSINEREIALKKTKKELEEVEAGLKEKSVVEEKLKKIESLEKKLENIQEIKINQTKLEKNKNQLERQIKQEEERLILDIKREEKDILRIETDIIERNKKLDSLLADEKNIPILEKQLQQQSKIEEQVNNIEKQREQYHQSNSALIRMKTELDQKIQIKQKEIKDLEDKLKTINHVKKEYEDKTDARKLLVKLEQEQIHLEQLITSLDEKYNNNNSEIRQYENEIKHIGNKITALSEEMDSLHTLADHAECPRCKQQLSQEHLTTILKGINSEIITQNELQVFTNKKLTDLKKIAETISRERIEKKQNLSDLKIQIKKTRRLQDGLDATKQKLSELKNIEKQVNAFYETGGLEVLFQEIKNEIQTLEKTCNSLKIDEQRYKQLKDEYKELLIIEEKLKQIKKSCEEIPSISKRIKTYQDTLAIKNTDLSKLKQKVETKDFSKELRIQVQKLADEITELSKQIKDEINVQKEYEQLKPDETRKKLEDIEKKEDRKIRLETTITNVSEEIIVDQKKLLNDNELIKDKKFVDLDKRLQLAEEKNNLINVEVENALNELTNAKRDVEDKQKEIEEQEKLRDKIKKIEENIGNQKELRDSYNILEKIFKGIGGRILSRLRDQINLTTSDILGRLGNPQLQGLTLGTKFELKVQTPKGDEVLSFFSGGQKIRIGFAFRLALSKVLAEFKGKEFNTLIIDEGGFGALDEEGQDGVIDVFNSIQNQFDRIIVISHIPRIADNLPGTQIRIDNGKILPMI